MVWWLTFFFACVFIQTGELDIYPNSRLRECLRTAVSHRLEHVASVNQTFDEFSVFLTNHFELLEERSKYFVFLELNQQEFAFRTNEVRLFPVCGLLAHRIPMF